MINYIKGVVTESMPGMVTIENGGFGWAVNIPEGGRAVFMKEGETVTLYTAMLVREDDISLYGFGDRESLVIFRMLMTVSGVGARAAMSILSALSPDELKRAVTFDDPAALTKANGIGKKLSQRIVLELKDKMDAPFGDAEYLPAVDAAPGSPKEEAVAALVSLGYTKSEALSSLVGIKTEGLEAGEIIRLALRQRR